MAHDDEGAAQMPARRLQDWATEAAAVRPCDQVVDLGSGTGTMSRRLAALVAPVGSADGLMGLVIGVDYGTRIVSDASPRPQVAGVSAGVRLRNERRLP
jgi:ubiquinone/menaquinone biosynthesis C-methylase UbiE